MIISPLTYINEAYDEPSRQSILGRMPAVTRDLIKQVKEIDWYPRMHAVHVYTAIAHHPRDLDGRVAEALFTMGKSVASRAVATFLQLVMKVMTVEVFARKVPDIWLRDHRGSALEVDTSDLANKHLVYRLKDVAGYDYIGGALPGYQTATLTAIGCKDLQYECDWTPEKPGPETVTCHFRWK
jgi:hypothetical protein